MNFAYHWLFYSIPLIYLGILFGFYLLQDLLIFRNSKLHPSYTFKFDTDFTEYNFKNDAGDTINSVLFKSKESKGVVHYSHGNTGNIQDWGGRANVFLEIGYDVLIYDYRGYGKSGGVVRKESQMHKDALLVYNELVKYYTTDQIIIYGISLGSGIASKLASLQPCKCLILETPYYNFLKTIKHHYPFLPVKVISKYKFKTNVYLKKVDVPVFLFHGTKDEIIPYQDSLDLIKRFKHIKLCTIPNGGHNDLPEFSEYIKGIEQALLE